MHTCLRVISMHFVVYRYISFFLLDMKCVLNDKPLLKARKTYYVITFLRLETGCRDTDEQTLKIKKQTVEYNTTRQC